jgi:two-component system CheB/CheR fusion protein
MIKPANGGPPNGRSDGGCPGCRAVVGIGASAGGLDAFKRLLEALSTDTGLAFVLVPHLHPSHESLMADLLAGQTST